MAEILRSIAESGCPHGGRRLPLANFLLALSFSRSLPFRYADAIEDEFHVGTVLLWHNYALNRAARPQSGHDSADCRSADMQFTSKPLPVGPRQSCRCVNPAFKRLQDTIPNVKRQTGWPTPWIASCPVLLIHDSNILPQYHFSSLSC